MKNKSQIAVGLLALLMTGHAAAGNRAGAVTLTLADAYYHFASSRHLNNTSLPNVALAYNFTDRWAIEADVGAINTDQKPVLGKAGVHGFLYTADAIYRFLPHKQFEPYLIAGVGLLSIKPNGLDSNNQGNINAGVGTQLFFSDMIALRGEVRDLYTTTGTGKNDYMINFGVSFLW
jgi:outer membrane beta-barrel protein